MCVRVCVCAVLFILFYFSFVCCLYWAHTYDTQGIGSFILSIWNDDDDDETCEPKIE